MIQYDHFNKIIFLFWKLHCNPPSQIHTLIQIHLTKGMKSILCFFMCYIWNIGSNKKNEQKSICTLLHRLLLLRQFNLNECQNLLVYIFSACAASPPPFVGKAAFVFLSPVCQMLSKATQYSTSNKSPCTGTVFHWTSALLSGLLWVSSTALTAWFPAPPDGSSSSSSSVCDLLLWHSLEQGPGRQ